MRSIGVRDKGPWDQATGNTTNITSHHPVLELSHHCRNLKLLERARSNVSTRLMSSWASA